MRILWIADIFFKYRGFVYNLLDVLPCSTFTLLGTTFALFWVEMYINTSVQLSDDQKRKYLIATISAYVAMNFLNYLSHIMVVVQYYDDDDVLLLDKMWENLVIVNVVFFVVTTILLAVAGQLLASHIKEIFNGPTGDFVSRRIRYVSVFCGLCFTIKSIMPLLLFSFNYSSSKYQGIDDLFILLYYGLMEIIPISILLILIKVSRPTTDEDDDDLLPEGLFPNYENSLTSSEGTSPRLLLRKSLISVGDESITQAFSERFTSATFSSFI